MTYRNRKGTDPEQRFDELEKEFGLDNIKDIPIADSFPDAGIDNAQIKFVEDGADIYLVLLAKGKRYKSQLTEF